MIHYFDLFSFLEWKKMINGDVNDHSSCRRWKNWIKHGITLLYVVVLGNVYQKFIQKFYKISVVVIPFLIWPLIHGDPGTHNPKKEAMIISTVFLLLTLPISIYSVANHLGKFSLIEPFFLIHEIFLRFNNLIHFGRFVVCAIRKLL